MTIDLKHLNDVREFLVNELDDDVARGVLYESTQMNAMGREVWPALLKQSFESGDPDGLVASVSAPGYWLTSYESMRNGKPVTTRINPDASATRLVNTEYIKYYIRAVCLAALDRGDAEVRIVRVRQSNNPRPDSNARVGQLINAAQLLADVRSRPFDFDLGIPPGPNSGLAVELL